MTQAPDTPTTIGPDTWTTFDPDKLPPWPVKDRPPIVDYDPFGKPFEDEKIFDDGF